MCVDATGPLKGHAINHNRLHAAVDLPKRSGNVQAAAGNAGPTGFKTVGYYASWSIYARNWPPQNIQSEQLTHLLYAFAGIDNKTGEASLTDPFADVQKKFDGDNPKDNSTSNLYGNLKQIYLLKKKNRNLKTLLSIGGWNLRTYFAPALANEQGRKTFARTGVQLLKDLGFDGLDIDWEYPNTTKQAQDLVDTCKAFRRELDNYSRNLTGNPHFLLTLAVPAGPDHFPYFDMQAMTPYVDFINLMAYDYAGSFSNFSGHAQNFYPSLDNPRSTNFSTAAALQYYLNETGWSPHKLTLGMPLYGHSFANTSGPGQAFSSATDGSWEAGLWDYKALAGNASFGEGHADENIVASWAYNSSTCYMVSYDTPEIARKKAEYVKDLCLGGAMWWELSGDAAVNGTGTGTGKGMGKESLIGAVGDYFEGFGGLLQERNVLDYPMSKYRNLRAGMKGE
ncbi:glycoside hydrolase family 18 protein [Cercospora zeae-maydis SCOH1-5]|uniref:chitinase n=1 Tax=Cercospora zeae-maydis SCOH1-5 TaxID=717836 RepID=A0A6A6FLM5_9PEZI|nr:glycoside hydrolase family 18 protein [Cercospora zeae-maydis SCOH1-5]